MEGWTDVNIELNVPPTKIATVIITNGTEASTYLLNDNLFSDDQDQAT